MTRQEELNLTFRPILLNLADCAKFPDKYLPNSLEDLKDVISKYGRFYRVSEEEWNAIITVNE